MASDRTVEQRLQELEDFAAVSRLVYTYGDCVNKGWRDEDLELNRGYVPHVFAADATWTDGDTSKTFHGRVEIVAMLEETLAAVDFVMHSFTNSLIDIEGDNAAASVLVWTGIEGNFYFEREDHTYTRGPTGWVIQTVRHHAAQAGRGPCGRVTSPRRPHRPY